MELCKHIIEYESKEDGWINLVGLGDIHLGPVNFDEDLLLKTVDYILENETLWIGMGDYCDAITTKDKRHDQHATDYRYDTPDKQYRKIAEILKPIQKTCLGLLDGNHELIHWVHRNHNYTDGLAYALNVPYLTIDAFIRLVFKRNSGKTPKRRAFDIYAHHGWTNARTMGYKINRIQDLSSIFPGLPLYLMGHTHLKGPIPPIIQLYVPRKMKVVHREVRHVFTGSFLKGYQPARDRKRKFSSYVEQKGYQPLSLGAPLIRIGVNEAVRPPMSPFRVSVGEVPV